MKKIFLAAAMTAAMGLNASAYFNGGITGTTGSGGYRGTKLDIVIGNDNLAFEPSLATYTSDSLDKTFRTYELRVAKETDRYTAGAEAGMTPKTSNYSNQYAGADITFSLTPGAGGHARLAGPGSRTYVSGGKGVARIDVGASLKEIMHKDTSGPSDLKTNQTEYSLYAGAKILMANLSASWTGFSYGTKDLLALAINLVPGESFPYAALPESSVNARLDLPGYPLVTPFVAYTGTKYKNGVKNSSDYQFGAYIDLNLITANVSYQIFDSGYAKPTYVSVGAGIKF